MVNLKGKPYYLTDEQVEWVLNTINSMTDEEKIGQLFVHLTASVNEEDVKEDIARTHGMGGIRFNPGPKEAMYEMNKNFQKYSKIPVLSAVNVEAGGNGASKDGTLVGNEMKVASTMDLNLAYKLGQICGKETRATGSNWAFAPIVDLVRNWRNPGIAVRGWGKDADLVLANSLQYFKGMQESNVACAMKHFPGDSQDERDPHVSTAVNDLSCEEWDATYGKVYQGMIDAGVQSLMPGHIMLPAYQKHFNPDCKEDEYKPATVCKELLQDLLRGKLGFNGTIVSDASHMIGLAGRGKRSELVPGAIMAGIDMFLFFNDIEEDYGYMMDAYKDGRLTKERVQEALERILALKAHVGLDHYELPSQEGLNVIGCEEHKKVAREVADKGIVLAKHVGPEVFPISAEKTKKVLLIQVGPKAAPELAMAGMAADSSKLDEKIMNRLQARGFECEVYKDPVKEFGKILAQIKTPEDMAKLKAGMGGNKGMYGMKQAIHNLHERYDLVIAYASVTSTMRTNNRLEWGISKGGWEDPWYVEELPCIFVSFNNPFHLADVSQIKNYINCFDASDTTIDVLVEKLCGDSEFKGVSTVDHFCGMIDTRF